MTLAIELIGALLLLPMWHPGTPGVNDGDQVSVARRTGLSLFHAVSAFCNSGLTLQNDSLCAYQYGWRGLGAHLVIAPLMLLGGLGYVVLREVALAMRGRAKVSTFSRMVLTATAVAYLLGVVAIAGARLVPYSYRWLKQGGEGTRPLLLPLDKHTLGMVLADASFMALSAPGSGFEIRGIDAPYAPQSALPPMSASEQDEEQAMRRLFPDGQQWERLSNDKVKIGEQEYQVRIARGSLPAEDVTCMALMSLGGAPGGMAGGVTVLAAGLIVAVGVRAVWGKAEGGKAEGGNREQGTGNSPNLLPAAYSLQPLCTWALAVAGAYAALVVVSTLLLALYETQPLAQLGFQAVSAASGNALSKSPVTSLTGLGRAVVLGTVLLGRVGMLYIMGMAAR
jgi:Trk-type K+ transport system membrane component